MSAAPRVRPLALAIIRRGDAILVYEAFDVVKGETFYRPLGGGIEFQERGSDAVARELREEIGVTARSTRFLGVLENIFVYLGKPGHEIALVYEVEAEEDIPAEPPDVADRSPQKTPGRVTWMPIAAFADAGRLLYPDGLLELLGTSTAAPRT